MNCSINCEFTKKRDVTLSSYYHYLIWKCSKKEDRRRMVYGEVTFFEEVYKVFGAQVFATIKRSSRFPSKSAPEEKSGGVLSVQSGLYNLILCKVFSVFSDQRA